MVMYNWVRFVAILQEAKKKPLVTKTLPDPSYPRGWRYSLDYDRCFAIGQTSPEYHRQQLVGERRWLRLTLITNHNSIAAPFVAYSRRRLAAIFYSGMWSVYQVVIPEPKGPV